jgi:hypothetical protein
VERVGWYKSSQRRSNILTAAIKFFCDMRYTRWTRKIRSTAVNRLYHKLPSRGVPVSCRLPLAVSAVSSFVPA